MGETSGNSRVREELGLAALAGGAAGATDCFLDPIESRLSISAVREVFDSIFGSLAGFELPENSALIDDVLDVDSLGWPDLDPPVGPGFPSCKEPASESLPVLNLTDDRGPSGGMTSCLLCEDLMEGTGPGAPWGEPAGDRDSRSRIEPASESGSNSLILAAGEVGNAPCKGELGPWGASGL